MIVLMICFIPLAEIVNVIIWLITSISISWIWQTYWNYFLCWQVVLECCHNERHGVPYHRLFALPFVQAHIKENIKAPPSLTFVTCGFPSQRASNAENVSIWWRHHVHVHSFVSFINRPTRVTRNSAALIDNIFTNFFCNFDNVFQSLIHTDVSDTVQILL